MGFAEAAAADVDALAEDDAAALCAVLGAALADEAAEDEGAVIGCPTGLAVGVALGEPFRRLITAAPTRITITTTATARIAGENRPGDQPRFRCPP